MAAPAAEQKQPLWVGLMVTGVGLFVVFMMITGPEGANVPLWVAYAAGSTFVFAGISITAHTLGLTWLNAIANVVIIAGLTAPGFWIMLDPAPKACSGSFGFSGLSVGGLAPDLQCRAVFGAGAIIVVLCGIALVVSMVRRLARRRRAD